jgi:predicted ATPase/DNA-binding SARP family transcriptional activator
MALPLAIRVLGELEIVRGGKTQPLPASKKTRALLGYLVVVRGRPQPRQRLCELFWDGPEDPRAGLRWSLTKIRPLVDDGKTTRLVADRDRVAFELEGATLDLEAAREPQGSLASDSLEKLRTRAALYRGELLEGLDLPECYRYHEWCVGEREAARRWRGTLLGVLVERLAGEPEPHEALSYARERVAIDPLAEAAHIAVMQLLAKLGRPREALKQYESCRRILEAQLGRGPSRELEVARAALGQVHASAPPETAVVAPATPPATTTSATTGATGRLLVGRDAERTAIVATLREVAALTGQLGPLPPGLRTGRRVLLVTGEPGMGKTRLLEEAAEQVAALGGATLAGRAFEAEMVRPYGPWSDVLRSVPRDAIEPALQADLAPLLPELGAPHAETGRNRLFGAVGKLLALRAAAGAGPLVIALDDLQWFDEASAALLHYLARSLSGERILLCCAARAAEMADNAPIRALLDSLLREDGLHHLALSPLSEAATGELVRSVGGGLDAERIFVDGGGNPLYSLELAHAGAPQNGAQPTRTLDALIAGRLSRLDEGATELLPWAAALGRAFSLDTLGALASMPVRDLLGAVAELERHGVLRASVAAAGGGGDATYDFAHDLVRRTAYRMMSEPRRQWLHKHIARTLGAVSDPDGALAADIAHHAALAGDSELAAHAYVTAGERCLRLFAYADASKLATSGLQHAARLQPPETAIRLRVALLGVQLHSNPWLKRPQELESELLRVARLAEHLRMHAEASRCHYLASFVSFGRGDLARAGASTIEAAHVGRGADIETRQHQLANTARCLAFIERDITSAEGFLREAQALGPEPKGGRTELEIVFGVGLIQAYKGKGDEATQLLDRAADLAALASDHWNRSGASIRAARIALERGRHREAFERCVTLAPLVAKLTGGSDAPMTDALRALSRIELGEADAYGEMEAAVDALRTIDSQAQLAFVLNALAAHHARAGRPDEAQRRAEQALLAAENVGHKSEAAVARAQLAVLAVDRGDRAQGRALLDACRQDAATPWALSARAQAALADASERLGVPAPAPARESLE